MGIELKKEWVATLDNRTRHAHAMADGQVVAVDKPFKLDGYDLMFPGDKSAPGYLVYNCRCTTIAAFKDYGKDAQRRSIDGVGKDVTYQEWAEQKKKAKPVTNEGKTAVKEEKTGKGNADVQTIGKIDIAKYKDVANGEIRSETLVLTNKQKEHIIKRRGQEFFDKYSSYFQDIALNPDYIFKDKTAENTAIASKTIDGEANIHLVIKLALVSDEAGLENSIITAIIEGDKRYRQRLRNNLPIYKKE